VVNLATQQPAKAWSVVRWREGTKGTMSSRFARLRVRPAHRDYWRAVEHPEIGRAIPYPRGPFMSEALGIAPRGRAPHLGEHTRLVLEGDLGLPAAQVDALAAAGVIR
jgi:hypothetical protein